MFERRYELVPLELLPFAEPNDPNWIADSFLPGYQYAESPVSNQSQILKKSPFGDPGWPCLWK
jgi:hypothetical protein